MKWTAFIFATVDLALYLWTRDSSFATESMVFLAAFMVMSAGEAA